MSSCANNKEQMFLICDIFRIKSWETENKIKTHVIDMPLFVFMLMGLNLIRSNLHPQNFIVTG